MPIYMQIVQQVRRQVASGELQPNDELPSIRILAERLVVNPNTVARAYRELEAAGIVKTTRGLGTFVAPQSNAHAAAEARALLADRVDALAIEANQMGITLPQLVEMLEQRAWVFQTSPESQPAKEAIRG